MSRRSIKNKHIGIIRIPIRMFLEDKVSFDFKGGMIRDIRFGNYFNEIEFMIEHPDMPEVREGEMIRTVNPEYVHIKRKQWKVRRVKGKVL